MDVTGEDLAAADEESQEPDSVETERAPAATSIRPMAAAATVTTLATTTGGTVHGEQVGGSATSIFDVSENNSYDIMSAYYGSTFRLTANSSSGYTFKGWYRGSELVSADNPIEITASSASGTLTAQFVEFASAESAEETIVVDNQLGDGSDILMQDPKTGVTVTQAAAGSEIVITFSGKQLDPNDPNYNNQVGGSGNERPARMVITALATGEVLFDEQIRHNEQNVIRVPAGGIKIALTYDESEEDPVTDPAAATPVPISSVTVNVTPPTAGTTVESAYYGVSVPADANYSVAGLAFYDHDPSTDDYPVPPIPAPATFPAGYTFYLLISLIANDGYMFSQVSPYTAVNVTGATLTSGDHLSVMNVSGLGSYGSCVVSFTIPAPGVADAYVDNTVDNSVSYVTGMVHITGTGGTQAGYGEGKTVYSNRANVTYSNPRTAQVQGMIDAAYTQAYNTANACKRNGKIGEFHMSTSESTGRVWDNRTYKTFTYNNATSQWEYTSGSGDTEVYTGEIPANAGTNTRIHVASGDYGKETYYRVEANGWVSGYTVTVTDDGNGTASAGLEASLAGETITLTATPNANYRFKEWQVISGGVTLTEDSFTMPAADVEIKAVFESTGTYTVTFDANGHGTAPAAQSVESGNAVAEPAAPTAEGWTFGGWYTEAACTNAFDFTMPITANITLYAKWTEESVTPPVPTTYTVTFDANGHGTAPAAQSVENGKTATKPTDPMETGWTFGGWYTEAACTNAFDFATAITGNITLYAKWTEEGTTPTPTYYTVTFDANGHGTAPAAQSVEDGKTATKPADPTASGWTFGGWYTEAACTNQFDFATPITGNITLFAKWTKDVPVEITYTVTSGANSTWTKGSSATVTITVKRNVDDDTCFSHFTGVQISGTTLALSGYEVKAGSTVITLKAATLQQFSAGTHTVTILFDDGTAATNLTIKAAPNGGTGTGSPKTGDESNLGLWLAIMVVSGLSLIGLAFTGRKSRYMSRH